MKNLYEKLGVPQNANTDEIKRVFLNLSKQYHPDLWTNAPEQVQKEKEEKFKDYTEAYEVLSNPDKRREYDTKLSLGVFNNSSSSKENNFKEDFFASSFNDDAQKGKMKAELYTKEIDIEEKIRNRTGEIYAFWNKKRDQLYIQYLPYMQEYKALEIQLRMADSEILNLKNMKTYQIMPAFYKKKKEKLGADYNIILNKYETLKKHITEYEQKKQEISSAVQTQLQNDLELLRLQNELKQVKEQLEALYKRRKR